LPVVTNKMNIDLMNIDWTHWWLFLL